MNTTNQKISRRDAESAEKTWAKNGAEPQSEALPRMTPEPQRKNTVTAPPAHMHAGRKWLALWGALIAGVVLGFLVTIPYGASLDESVATKVLDLLLLPLSAIIVAALGPLFLVCCGEFAFHVEGGRWVAIGSLAGILLLYAALILGLRRWWKTDPSRARLFGLLALAAYNALVTFCVSAIGPSI